VEEARKARTGALPPATIQRPREITGQSSGAEERRKHARHPSNAIVEVIRLDDSRRISLPVEVVDVSAAGIGLVTVEPFAPDDRVKIRIRNDVRRFCKEAHGLIRWAQLTPEGEYRIGIELNTRFSSLDIQLLKQLGGGGPQERVWV
jgi:hypothetical protein